MSPRLCKRDYETLSRDVKRKPAAFRSIAHLLPISMGNVPAAYKDAALSLKLSHSVSLSQILALYRPQQSRAISFGLAVLLSELL
jgi:hypothetical protein